LVGVSFGRSEFWWGDRGGCMVISQHCFRSSMYTLQCIRIGSRVCGGHDANILALRSGGHSVELHTQCRFDAGSSMQRPLMRIPYTGR